MRAGAQRIYFWGYLRTDKGVWKVEGEEERRRVGFLSWRNFQCRNEVVVVVYI